MPSRTDPFVTGLVLGAGGSSRLGAPKQLLPYGDGTLLGHVVGVASGCRFDQLVVAIGGSADEVRASVDLTGAEVVVNDSYGAGCSSSIAAALGILDPRCDVIVLMLGDQPGVTAATVAALLDGRRGAPLAICRYDDGRGHPIAFARDTFGDLADLHGDRGVWRLLDQRASEVVEVAVAGPIPLDVDTPEDYRAVLSLDPPILTASPRRKAVARRHGLAPEGSPSGCSPAPPGSASGAETLASSGGSRPAAV